MTDYRTVERQSRGPRTPAPPRRRRVPRGAAARRSALRGRRAVRMQLLAPRHERSRPSTRFRPDHHNFARSGLHPQHRAAGRARQELEQTLGLMVDLALPAHGRGPGNSAAADDAGCRGVRAARRHPGRSGRRARSRPPRSRHARAEAALRAGIAAPAPLLGRPTCHGASGLRACSRASSRPPAASATRVYTIWARTSSTWSSPERRRPRGGRGSDDRERQPQAVRVPSGPASGPGRPSRARQRREEHGDVGQRAAPLQFQLRKLGHVGAQRVADLEASVRFCTEVLGLEISDRYPDEHGAGRHGLHALQRRSSRRGAGRRREEQRAHQPESLRLRGGHARRGVPHARPGCASTACRSSSRAPARRLPDRGGVPGSRRQQPGNLLGHRPGRHERLRTSRERVAPGAHPRGRDREPAAGPAAAALLSP